MIGASRQFAQYSNYQDNHEQNEEYECNHDSNTQEIHHLAGVV